MRQAVWNKRIRNIEYRYTRYVYNRIHVRVEDVIIPIDKSRYSVI